MKQINMLLLLATGFYFTANAQADKALSKKLTGIQKASNLPGFAVSIIKNDSVVFSNGFGYADKEAKTPYTPQTIQPVGSVSKTVIGLALMKAMELEYFTLETDVNSILPFKIINPYQPGKTITIRHLVTHTSSLVDDETVYMGAYNTGKQPLMKLGIYLQEYCRQSGKFYKATNFDTAAIGTVYHYSNIAAALAAYLIEVKAGMGFDAFTEKYIFTPLGMADTHWFYNEAKSKQYATLYMVNKPESEQEKQLMNADGSFKIYSCATYPDGSLKTSVADLTKYMLAMMKGYFGQGGIVSKESFALLFAPQFTAATMPANMDKKEVNRAVFWAYTPKGVIRHTGSDPGLMAFVSFDPAKKIARAFTLNTQLEGEDNIPTVKAFMAIIAALDAFEAKL
jgi:CubicO group peptidase (beta-lactamase class C family)